MSVIAVQIDEIRGFVTTVFAKYVYTVPSCRFNSYFLPGIEHGVNEASLLTSDGISPPELLFRPVINIAPRRKEHLLQDI